MRHGKCALFALFAVFSFIFFFSSKSSYFDVSLISLLVAHILAYGILKCFMVCMYCIHDVLFS